MTPTPVVHPRARCHRWKGYTAYKPTAVPWLATIPDHWATLPFKRVASIRYGLGQPPPEMIGGVPLIRAANVDRGAISDKEMMYVDATQLPEGKQATLSAGEIIVVRSGAYTGDSAIVPPSYAGAIAGYDMVAKITVGLGKFFGWQLLSREVQELQFGFVSLRAAQPHLNAEELGTAVVVCPPILEQRQIASFLDRETAKIDALIAKKHRLIELLQEKRTALICQAVTKGLDPRVPMKDSGYDWLGDIPKCWQAARIRYVARLESGHTPSRQHPEYWVDCTTPWFTLADVWQLREGGRKYVSDTEEKVSELGLANSAARLLPRGTVILSRTASVGFTGILDRPMATSQDFVNWICGPK